MTLKLNYMKNGEIKKADKGQAWLLGLKKYFHGHDYFENMKVVIVIFNMRGNESI